MPADAGTRATTEGTPATTTSGDERPTGTTASGAPATPTLQQYLDELCRGYPWGDGRDYERTSSPLKTAAGVAGSKRMNPAGKVPTPAQSLELQRLVDLWNDRCAPRMTAEWGERKNAMRRSIAGDRVETSLLPFVDPFDQGAVRDAGAAVNARREGILRRLADRLGVGEDDWVHIVVSTGKPDGVLRECIVYFTRQQEPAYFAARDAYRRLKDEREAVFRRFFERL